MLRALSIDVLNDEQFRRALEQAPETLRKHLKKSVGRGGQEAARELKRNAPKAHSTLVNSIRSARDGELTAIAAPNTDYAAFINNGSQPGGAPPLQALIDWIRVKGITPNNPAHDQRDLAFMIRRSIARNGIKPQPFNDEAAEKITPRIEQLLRQSVTNALAEVGL
ncbi:HK97 gp10 family phage protein [Endozoicomonas ascidiicola]|uniref:HK97 gp10 family phage protein n=1 Tax=Endozoicomonas ascidiicola TaxID=1698521 RepID=UPI00082B03DA|nr:HK97 gp10 family phage protein [Endozoicomonas ascidiicola]